MCHQVAVCPWASCCPLWVLEISFLPLCFFSPWSTCSIAGLERVWEDEGPLLSLLGDGQRTRQSAQLNFTIQLVWGEEVAGGGSAAQTLGPLASFDSTHSHPAPKHHSGPPETLYPQHLLNIHLRASKKFYLIRKLGQGNYSLPSTLIPPPFQPCGPDLKAYRIPGAGWTKTGG